MKDRILFRNTLIQTNSKYEWYISNPNKATLMDCNSVAVIRSLCPTGLTPGKVPVVF